MVPSAGQQRDPRNGLLQAEQKAQELRKHSRRTVLPLPRRARSQQFPQNQAQVERAHMDQLPLQNVFAPAQMAAPHPARLVAVRETTFDELAAPPPQTLAVLAPHPPPVRIHRLLLRMLARPVPSPLLFLLRNVTALAVTERDSPFPRGAGFCATAPMARWAT